MIENILRLLILNICYKNEISTSYYFNRIFLKLGIITPVGSLIEELKSNNFLDHNGLFENETSIYKSLRTTKKGREYYEEQIKNIIIPKGEFSEEREKQLKKYLEI